MSALPHIASTILEAHFKQLPAEKTALIQAEYDWKEVDVTLNTNIQVVK